MTLDAGQIVLLPFPHTNLKSGKKRPSLVLTDSRYNAKSSDVVLAFVTPQKQTGKWSVGIASDDLATGQLVKDSWVRVDRLATVEQRLVKGVVGQLEPDMLKRVQSLLVALLGD